MKTLPNIRPSKTALVLLVVAGTAALLVALFGFGSKLVGSICLDGWLSDSTGSGRCSGHGGVDTDRTVNTLIGQQPGNWIWLTQWPMLGLGVVGSGLGTAGLVRHRSDAKKPSRNGSVSERAGAETGGRMELLVSVDATGDGYVAELISPVGASARGVLGVALPVDRGLSELQEELRLPPRRRIGSRRNRAVERFGTTLFDSLFEGPLEGLYRDSLDHAISLSARLNIVLQLHESIADIPWEYMFDESKGAYLALSQDTSLSRRISTLHSTSPLLPDSTLRILTMRASPADLDSLDLEAEHQKIESELQEGVTRGTVELRAVSGSSLDDLRAALDDFEPHVLHFSGHGRWDPELDDGVVAFANHAGVSHETTGRALGVLLNRNQLRLAVFNSCDAARSSKTDRFAGITSSLVAQGVPAAIGMQFRFDDQAASTFGCAFLGRLAESRSVTEALFAARTAVFTMPNDIEWATPVLTARVPLDEVLSQPSTRRAARR